MRLKLISSIIIVCCILFAVSRCNTAQEWLYQSALNSKFENTGLVSQQITINGHTIHYLENSAINKASTLILLHGYAADSNAWLDLAKLLSPSHHLIIPDLPGHGKSTQDLTLDYGYSAQAIRLKRFTEALNLRAFHLSGNSMGGSIAMIYCYLYPKDVISLTLVNAAGLNTEVSEITSRLENINSNPLIVNNEHDFDTLLEWLFVNKPYVPAPVKTSMVRQQLIRRDINALIFNHLQKDFNEQHTKLIASKVTAPTLIIWGDKDRIIHQANADAFHSLITNSKKVIFKNIGHVPMIEAPKLTSQAYLNFLENIAPFSQKAAANK